MNPLSNDMLQLLQGAGQAMQSGNVKLAETKLHNVLDSEPNEPNALFLMGGVRKMQGDLSEAVTYMRAALKAHPNPAQVHNSIGNVLKERGAVSEAELAYIEATKINKNYADAFFNLGLLHHENTMMPKAIENLEQATALSPQNPAFHNALGTAYKDTDRFQDAEITFKRSLALQPNYFKALSNLGGLLRKQYRFEEAISILTKAVQLAPKVIEPRYILANIYYEMGEFDKADEAYRTIIAIKPDFEDAHVSLNRLYWEHGKTDLYGKSYVVGIKACPDSVELCEQHLLALESVGRIDEAIDFAVGYVSSFPEHAGLQQKMARLHVFNGNTDAARDYYGTAIKLDPDNVGTRLDVGKLMLEQGEYKAAHQELDVAEALTPDNQRMWAYRSLCWRMQNDERHEWLNDYNRYVAPASIATPKGYKNTSEFLAALKQDLKKYHTTRQAPVDQTLRGGSQTHGKLFDRPDQTIHLLKNALEEPINAFMSELSGGDKNHPLHRRHTGKSRFATSWSIWLRDGGFHVNHIHTMGWISSSFYVDMPNNSAEQDDAYEGWIKFGESALKLGSNDVPARYVKPEPGMLVLFPSYMWHGTVSYHSDADRITAPFDLLPV